MLDTNDVTAIMAIVIPDFRIIVHDIGCIPHNARTVNIAPVITTSNVINPIKNLIVVYFKVNNLQRYGILFFYQLKYY